MASLLRQIVAGPRARHPEAGLDLCYVTDNIIATSGPSGTYPQRAYRNPLDSLVKFLNYKHGQDWAIWEFRAEGTGYPDSEVYNRVYHYPFPDHHPPPFALIPNIMASMRNWLHEKKGRVVVVHCKAGKGRSGTASCSYLISEEGWKVEDALKRFTERRMRPGFGTGVSIPSQLRWIGYVGRWTQYNKIYVERQVEILELHCWGLREGVKISIEGFVHDGKAIKLFHTFTRPEREIVRGEIASTGGLADLVSEVIAKNGIGRSNSKKELKQAKQLSKSDDSLASPRHSSTFPLDGNGALKQSPTLIDLENKGGDVVFRPSKRVVLLTNDINIDVERRNKAAYGLTMVTAVAHVWFNSFFEGNGPEKGGVADSSGVFEIEWEAMDGIKGSSRKGTKAFDKIAVVWRALPDESGEPGIIITEPKEGEEVKQTSPADWTGQDNVEPSEDKDLGLRTSSPVEGSSSAVSRANSVKSTSKVVTASDPHENTSEGIRCHGPNGEEEIEAPSHDGPPAPPPSEQTHAQLGGGLNSQSNDDGEVPRVQSPESNHLSSRSGIAMDKQHESSESSSDVITGKHVSTSDLPGGRPEEEMKTAHEHSLGRLTKKGHTSS